MRKHVLVLTTTAAILSCGAIASAQAPSAQTPGTQQSPTTQPPSGPMMQQQDQTRLQRRAQSGGEEDSDQAGYHGYPGGMMGGGMMGQGYGHRTGIEAVPTGWSHDDANDFQSNGR